MKKKDFKEKLPAFGKSGKMGTYTFIITVIVLAALVVVNLIAATLPSKYTAFDTSSSKMYTLSDTTKEFVSAVEEDITMYFVCENSSEDSKLRTFLDRFADLSSKIKIKVVDPLEETSFLEKYDAEDANNYSVIVVTEKRSKVVDYNDMYYYYNDYIGQLTADEYSSYYSYYGSYLESYYGTFTEYFDGDNQLTGAIEYTTADKVPMVYLLEGHLEEEFSDTITSNLFDYGGIDTETLNIALDEDTIPEDADVIIINNPLNDLSAAEAEKLTAFVKNGGKVILITATGCEEFENLAVFTTALGMKAQAGTVSEGDSSKYYTRSPKYIYATVNTSHDALENYSSMVSSYRMTCLVPNAHGIELSEVDGVTTSALLTTSSKAYTGDDSSVTASYNLAASAECGDGKLIWIGSSQLLSDTFVNGTNGGNFYVFYFLFNWAHGSFTSALPEIAGVELSEPTITVTESAANLWGTVLIVAVPLCFIAGGLVYWLYRRRK